MTRNRHRLLTIAAATPVAGRLPPAETLWQGHAFGAAASIVLRGPHGATGPALAAAVDTIRRMEAAFSLHQPDSELARLNRDGTLAPMSADMRALLARADRLHSASGGLFDPTVQSLWTGTGAAPGWTFVRREPRSISLAPGQGLTFDGIAQGFATDAVSAVLATHGLRTTLVNIGELRGRGGPWQIVPDAAGGGDAGWATFGDGAVATSAPGSAASREGGRIVDPRDPGRPAVWVSVTVEADDATTADGASTALCLAEPDTMREMMAALPGLRRVSAVGPAGNIVTLRG